MKTNPKHIKDGEILSTVNILKRSEMKERTKREINEFLVGKGHTKTTAAAMPPN